MPRRRTPLVPLQVTASTAPRNTSVLVIAESPVNRVVISRMVERAGVRTLCETPENAIATLAAQQPTIVVLDHAAANHGSNPLLHHLAEQKQASGGALPFVVLLVGADGTDQDSDKVDETLTMPIVPERMTPVISKLLSRAQGE